MRAPDKKPGKLFTPNHELVFSQYIPSTVVYVYSFAAGISFILSLAAGATQLLNYLTFSFNLTITTPAAAVVGLWFVYLKYVENQNKQKALKIEQEKIQAISSENNRLNKRLSHYFLQEKEEEAQRDLARKIGRYHHKKPAFWDEKNLRKRATNTFTTFITDSVFTLGSSIFVLSTFSTITLSSNILVYVTLFSMAIAGLLYLWMHSKNHKHDKMLSIRKDELSRQSNINSEISAWMRGRQIPESNEDENTATEKCWADELLLEGYLREMLVNIRTAVNVYLFQHKVTPPNDETTTQKFLLIGGKIPEHETTVLQNANTKQNCFSRNISTAIGIAYLVEEGLENSESYAATLHKIKLMAKKARHHSPWSWVGMGESSLADAIDKIFWQSSETAIAQIDAATPLVSNTQNLLHEKLAPYPRLQRCSTLAFTT